MIPTRRGFTFQIRWWLHCGVCHRVDIICCCFNSFSSGNGDFMCGSHLWFYCSAYRVYSLRCHEDADQRRWRCWIWERENSLDFWFDYRIACQDWIYPALKCNQYRSTGFRFWKAFDSLNLVVQNAFNSPELVQDRLRIDFLFTFECVLDWESHKETVCDWYDHKWHWLNFHRTWPIPRGWICGSWISY